MILKQHYLYGATTISIFWIFWNTFSSCVLLILLRTLNEAFMSSGLSHLTKLLINTFSIVCCLTYFTFTQPRLRL